MEKEERFQKIMLVQLYFRIHTSQMNSKNKTGHLNNPVIGILVKIELDILSSSRANNRRGAMSDY